MAGGILIPSRDLTIVGSLDTGVTVNGEPARVRDLHSLNGVGVLASRSEVKRGQWECFADAPFDVEPMGSVACKMALVAAGLADATWTLVPKNEWDVAGGTALVRAAGGAVWRPVPKSRADPGEAGTSLPLQEARAGLVADPGFFPAALAQ